MIELKTIHSSSKIYTKLHYAMINVGNCYKTRKYLQSPLWMMFIQNRVVFLDASNSASFTCFLFYSIILSFVWCCYYRCCYYSYVIVLLLLLLLLCVQLRCHTGHKIDYYSYARVDRHGLYIYYTNKVGAYY
jgi:hypothetical protein